MNALLDRLRALLRRVLFWLPSANPSEEVAPDAVHDHDLLISVTSTGRFPRLRQLRYVSRVLSVTERRVALASLVAFVVGSVGVLGYLASTRMVRVPVAGGTLIEAVVGEPKYVNPVDAPANDVDRDLSSLIFSGLFRMNGMEPEPDLAERYAWSPDGKTLTVTLRQDARFHDGENVTAADVEFTIDSIQDPARNSPLAPRFRGVKATATNQYTVQFDLDKPDVSLLTALTVGILPQSKWQDIPSANARLADLNVKPIGSGPYRMKSFTRDSKGFIRSYTLERFDQYAGVKPFIQTLVFQFFADRKSAEDALKADLVDALAFSSLAGQKKNASARWQTVELELPQETLAFFNLKKKLLQDENVRRALSGVIDRQELVDAWNGYAVPVGGPYPFESATATTASIEQARSLLDASGWRLPSDGSIRTFSRPTAAPKTKGSKKGTAPAGVTAASSTELTITIITSDQPELTAVAEILKRHWSQLGAKVTVSAFAPEEFLRQATRDRAADVILTTVLLNTEQDLFPFWWSAERTDRGLNLSSLADRDVDAALEATRAAASTSALSNARAAVSTSIRRSTPAIFLVRPTSPYLISKKVYGASPRVIMSQPADRFNDLRKWYVKTGLRWK